MCIRKNLGPSVTLEKIMKIRIAGIMTSDIYKPQKVTFFISSIVGVFLQPPILKRMMV